MPPQPVLGQAQDLVGRGRRVVGGKRGAVVKGDILPQIEKPGFAVCAAGVAFRQAGLGTVIVVQGKQPLVHQIGHGHKLPLHRSQGVDLGGQHADDAQVHALLGQHFGPRHPGEQQQRQQRRRQALTPGRGNNAGNRWNMHRIPFPRNSACPPWGSPPAAGVPRRRHSS